MTRPGLPINSTFKISKGKGNWFIGFLNNSAQQEEPQCHPTFHQLLSDNLYFFLSFPFFFFQEEQIKQLYGNGWFYQTPTNVSPSTPLLRPRLAPLITLTSDFEMGESAALEAGLGRAASDLNLLFISQRAGSTERTRNITAPAVILCHRAQKASSTFQNHISTLSPKAPFNPSSLIACGASPLGWTAKTAMCLFLSPDQPQVSLLFSTPGHAKLFIPGQHQPSLPVAWEGGDCGGEAFAAWGHNRSPMLGSLPTPHPNYTRASPSWTYSAVPTVQVGLRPRHKRQPGSLKS